MAKGNCIIVSPNPRGVFKEVIVSGTPKPGTVMELKKATAVSSGAWTYEPAGTTAANGVSEGMSGDGLRLTGIAVLLGGADKHAAVPPGRTSDDAYVSGDRGVVYFPLPGEELNMILENQSGTADDFIIGSKLIVDDGTGKLLLSAGTTEQEPFICLEAHTDMTADTLVHCLFAGGGG